VTAAGLRELLRDCLVQIDEADGTPAGSGFFVAPGYVVSCAHVVRRPASTRVTGTWHTRPWLGRVAATSEAPPSADTEIWPEPDLVVIRLDDEELRHPCVRLASRPPEDTTTMFAIGRRAAFGVPRDFPSAELHYVGQYEYLMRLTGDRFWPGMSGGPVVNLSTGLVCGVLKTADSDRDGYAVPVPLLGSLPGPGVARDLLRAHDRYHGANAAWTGAQGTLDPPIAPLLTPASEAELLDLLAQLPDAEPARLAELYRDCAGPEPHPLPGELRDWRDVALGLTEHLHTRGQLHPVVVLAETLASRHAPVSSRLRDWATAESSRQGTWELLRSRRAGPPAARAAGGLTSAIVQLEPSAMAPDPPDRYVFTLWQCHGDTDLVQVARQDEPLGIDEIAAALTGKLPAVLGQLPGQPIVECILPAELFDLLPVHEWQVFAHPYARLGLRYPVVIRDYDRCHDEESRNHARLRWDWLSAQQGVTLHWLDCVSHPAADHVYRLFEETHERAALGVPGPSGGKDGPVSTAIYAGVVVALWRRESCSGHDGPGPCDGMMFRHSADNLFSTTPIYDLPAMFRSARAGQSSALSDASLLWDNPHRGPHPRPLAVQ
jgi:vWA-MoxR associated protein C-terminal domain/Trypsin-like peptidase domain/vWA-MoxR associated protein middle region 0